MTALILFGVFFLLLFMNMPIAFALGISSLATLMYEGLPLLPVASNLYAATSKFVLLAIPFFILGGNVMDKSGISGQLIDFARTLVGHRRSGHGLVTVIVALLRGHLRLPAGHRRGPGHDPDPRHDQRRL